jgi:hypothetical protein
LTWFILEEEKSFDSLKDSFLREKVPIAEIEIIRPRKVFGLVFPDCAENIAKRELGVIRFLKKETDVWGVSLISEAPLVDTDESSGFEMWDRVKPLLEVYAKQLGMLIRATNPHCDQDVYDSEDILYIAFYSVPIRTKEKYYNEVFSIPLECDQGCGFEPSFEGVPIIDECSRSVIAEIFPNNLYILFDLLHAEDSPVDEILEKIMDKYMTFRREPEEYMRSLKDFSSEKYLEECSKGLDDNISKVKERIRLSEEEIRTYKRNMIKAIREKTEDERKLKMFSRSVGDTESYLQEFDKIYSMPDVERVFVSDGVIRVFTKVIVIKFEEAYYRIGKFKIDIFVEDGDISIYNLTGKIGGTGDHPHIDDGHCCFGNIEVSIAERVGSYQYSILIEVLIKYLKSVNSKNWYSPITDWPKFAGREEAYGC